MLLEVITQQDDLLIRRMVLDWEPPEGRVHRGVNAGAEPYEEVVIFFLDTPRGDIRRPPLTKRRNDTGRVVEQGDLRANGKF